MLKAQIVFEIADVMKSRKLTQSKVAALDRNGSAGPVKPHAGEVQGIFSGAADGDADRVGPRRGNHSAPCAEITEDREGSASNGRRREKQDLNAMSQYSYNFLTENLTRESTL